MNNEEKCPWFSPSFQEKVGLCFEQLKPFYGSVILHGFSAAEHCQQLWYLTHSHFGNAVCYSSIQLLAAAKKPAFKLSFNIEMMQINDILA